MENHYTLTTLHLGNLDIELLDLYQMLAVPTPSIYSHNHAFWEIYFILNGNATMCIQQKRYAVEKNSILIIPKNQIHFCENHSPDFSFSAFCFELKYAFAPPVKKLGEYGYFTELFHLNEACVLPMTGDERRLVETILSNHNDFSVYAINKINIETTNLFLEMAKKLDEHKNLRLDSVYTSIHEEDALRKYKIENFILSHYEQPVTLEDLSKFLSLSVRQTTRYIKETFGLTFKELLTKQRMLHAEDLIKKSNQSLHEIATKVGFTSYNGFISAYEKHFGKHPKK